MAVRRISLSNYVFYRYFFYNSHENHPLDWLPRCGFSHPCSLAICHTLRDDSHVVLLIDSTNSNALVVNACLLHSRRQQRDWRQWWILCSPPHPEIWIRATKCKLTCIKRVIRECALVILEQQTWQRFYISTWRFCWIRFYELGLVLFQKLKLTNNACFQLPTLILAYLRYIQRQMIQKRAPWPNGCMEGYWISLRLSTML